MTTICSYEACDETSSGTLRKTQPGKCGYKNYLYIQHCIYCESPLVGQPLNDLLTDAITRFKSQLDSSQSQQRFEPHSQYEGSSLTIRHCPTCGWWLLDYHLHLLHVGWTSGVPDSINKVLYGEVKHYDISALQVPLTALRTYLSTHPRHMAHVHPTQFEKLMGSCLQEYFGAVEVVHTGKSGDGGVDLKMIHQSKTYLVQVKRRTRHICTRRCSVQSESRTASVCEGRAKGMIVTTAGGFTAAAQREASVETATSETYEMRLLAFDDVFKMLRLNCPSPYTPWLAYLKDIDVSNSDHFLKTSYFGRQKCVRCSGAGQVKTGGGCCMEHGISTSCEEYGCLPVTYGECPNCGGTGYIAGTSC